MRSVHSSPPVPFLPDRKGNFGVTGKATEALCREKYYSEFASVKAWTPPLGETQKFLAAYYIPPI